MAKLNSKINKHNIIESYIDSVNRKLVDLKSEIELLEQKKILYRNEAAANVSLISPKHLHKIFGNVEDIFSITDDRMAKSLRVNKTKEEVSDHKCTIISTKYFESEDLLLNKVYNVEGRVGNFSYSLVFTTEFNLNENSYKESVCSVSKLDILNINSHEMLVALNEEPHKINILVPALYFLKDLLAKRMAILNELEEYQELIIKELEETNAVFIKVKVSEKYSFDLNWNIYFNAAKSAFDNMIFVAPEVKISQCFSSHKHFKIINGEEPLQPYEIVPFLESIFTVEIDSESSSIDSSIF